MKELNRKNVNRARKELIAASMALSAAAAAIDNAQGAMLAATRPRNCDLYEDHEDSWDAFCKERDATGRGDSYPYDEYEMWLFRKAVAPGKSVWFDLKRS